MSASDRYNADHACSTRRASRSFVARAAGVAVVLASLVAGVNCSSIIVPREGWSREWGPMVPHGTFPGDCGICHVAERWDVLREEFSFDHAKETGFELEGAHSRAVCLRCHNDRGPVEMYVERGCGGCHVDPHEGSLGIDCARCHGQEVWDPTGLIADHAATRFPLTGLHAIVPCEGCHKRATIGDFRAAPVVCHLCHQRDAARAFPNHPVNGWVRGCERCHTPASWDNLGFNHTVFPLEGGHAGLDCTQCHVGGRVFPTPNDCFFCHRQDYINADDHVEENFSTNCTECHDIFSWEGADDD